MPLYAYEWTLHGIIEDDIKQQGRQDIMQDLTFYGAHIEVGATGKIALLCYIAPAGCFEWWNTTI